MVDGNSDRSPRGRGADASPVIIEAALNGGRDRRDHPDIPYTPEEVAHEAIACVDAGASIVHIHARGRYGAWSASPAWYSHAIRRIRHYRPNVLISLTSIRPDTIPVDVILGLITTLANSDSTRPDLISVNLGHLMLWEHVAPGDAAAGRPIPRPIRGIGLHRRTVHYPNSYSDVVALLDACRTHGIVPELGIMDLGFVSNAVTLHEDGLIGDQPWCLVELDSPRYGSGAQVAPSSTEDYDVITNRMLRYLPGARLAAHGSGRPGFAVLDRALSTGAHLRVGFEDSVVAPDGRRAHGNAELVGWAAGRIKEASRTIATAGEAFAIVSASDTT
jgi:3-keto-5-aminohexanoate cleavage enzyme